MPKVGIVMGSDSDLKVMSKAASMLEKFGIDYEMTIISAHRMPDVFFEWAKAAEGKGIKVIIAGAGMAAHLPGMCAALFPMPVIGVPMSGKNLDGMDALYSIVQMPPGIPVATVAIDGGMNAAILAAKILAVSDEEVLTVSPKNDEYTAHTSSSFVGQVLEKAGFKNAIQSDDREASLSLEQLVEINPDIIVYMRDDIDTTIYTEWKDTELYKSLDAVKNNKVYTTVARGPWTQYRGFISVNTLTKEMSGWLLNN